MKILVIFHLRMERFDGGKLTIYEASENENISGIAPGKNSRIFDFLSVKIWVE
ncbi:hypothetical protein [Dapis sp. BLCC M172]|uniref:hypothetical protein n=1 Tax=Dapis sp. BLCC M172 TaxID=2975281 RepID=UPI003CE74CD0